MKNQNLRTQTVDGNLYASLPDLLQTQTGRSRGMEGRQVHGKQGSPSRVRAVSKVTDIQP